MNITTDIKYEDTSMQFFKILFRNIFWIIPAGIDSFADDMGDTAQIQLIFVFAIGITSFFVSIFLVLPHINLEAAFFVWLAVYFIAWVGYKDWENDWS